MPAVFSFIVIVASCSIIFLDSELPSDFVVELSWISAIIISLPCLQINKNLIKLSVKNLGTYIGINLVKFAFSSTTIFLKLDIVQNVVQK